MRLLLDECLDPGIRDFLTGHKVTTVGEANWQGTADKQLVQLAQGTSMSYSPSTAALSSSTTSRN
jgi:hypothetical protein